MLDTLKEVVQTVPAPILTLWFVWKIVKVQRAKKNGNGNGTSKAVVQNAEQQQMLSHLKEGVSSVGKVLDKVEENTTATHKLLDRYDDDGIPLCYVPRSWAAMQHETIVAMREISETQRTICSTLDVISRTLEKVLDRA